MLTYNVINKNVLLLQLHPIFMWFSNKYNMNINSEFKCLYKFWIKLLNFFNFCLNGVFCGRWYFMHIENRMTKAIRKVGPIFLLITLIINNLFPSTVQISNAGWIKVNCFLSKICRYGMDIRQPYGLTNPNFSYLAQKGEFLFVVGQGNDLVRPA